MATAAGPGPVPGTAAAAGVEAAKREIAASGFPSDQKPKKKSGQPRMDFAASNPVQRVEQMAMSPLRMAVRTPAAQLQGQKVYQMQTVAGPALRASQRRVVGKPVRTPADQKRAFVAPEQRAARVLECRPFPGPADQTRTAGQKPATASGCPRAVRTGTKVVVVVAAVQTVLVLVLLLALM